MTTVGEPVPLHLMYRPRSLSILTTRSSSSREGAAAEPLLFFAVRDEARSSPSPQAASSRTITISGGARLFVRIRTLSDRLGDRRNGHQRHHRAADEDCGEGLAAAGRGAPARLDAEDDRGDGKRAAPEEA